MPESKLKRSIEVWRILPDSSAPNRLGKQTLVNGDLELEDDDEDEEDEDDDEDEDEDMEANGFVDDQAEEESDEDEEDEDEA